ncbi:hypothetical protein [Campylobacter concisus]|uniref:hypothetical protein n=1 Tax=Campylobacter concisus TaxID=199 RepID=UPI000A0E0207|nr:hypothetical protein [Campylobacter concisus]ORI04179.1 hypothetical protein A3223_01300 [Campylobacter concisus]
MQAIIATIVLFFRFFKWENAINFVFKAVTFSKMVVINVILGALVLSYAAAVIYIINFIYSKFNYIIDYVNNLSVGNEKIVTIAFSILKSLGAWNAFCDVFSIFSPIFLSFFVIYATKIGITVFRFVRETLVTFILAKL